MKNSLFICSIVVALLNTFTSALGQSEYELAHEKEEAERRAMIAANLSLLDPEEEAFWNLYAEPRRGDDMVALVAAMSETIEQLSLDIATTLVAESAESPE